MAISKSQRKQVEQLVYDVFDKVDKTGANTEYYKQLFSKMSDEKFFDFFKRRLPLRYHSEIFKNEPEMSDIFDAFKVLNKPLIEKVKCPYLYKNKKGEPIETQEALVVYIHIKRMKQMLSKKTSIGIDADKRDMKTGRLLGADKAGQETDREFEALAAMDLPWAMDEFARPKADAMRAKSQMHNVIMTKGFISADDIEIDKDDSLAKNLLNVYLIGANIHSNLIDEDYLTPHTISNRQKQIERR